jgi:aspartyl-tRNA(Asn)/glutamyl-tRNA(Gln) amidotransferase subunit A
MKPTYGRVSRYGLVAFASSLDQIGPFARTVADAALLLEAVSGHDPRDATSAGREVPPFSRALDGRVESLRIGVPRRLLETGVDADVLDAFEASLRSLEALGARVRDVELPHSRYAIPVYYLVATAEASSNLARYDGVRYGRREAAASLVEMYERTRNRGFGAEVKRRIMLGTYVLSAGYYDAYYLKAQQVRTLIRRDFERAFHDVDAVAVPTTPTAAFPLGERVDDPLQMYLGDIFTVSAPLAGLPAVSVPCGFTRDGLPTGLQLTGRAWEESTLLRLADAYERTSPWAGMHPAVG